MPDSLNVKNTITLLRLPFSFLLMPLFLLALSQLDQLNLIKIIWTFIILHLLVYPASNGYNSFIDKDESSIGGLEKPPLATKLLFYVTLTMDLAAIFLSITFVNLLFAICIFLYILASRAYSSKKIRLKKYPFLGFFIVVIFQGGFTYFMCTVGLSVSHFDFSLSNIFIMLACSFQIAGAYPLTQIYQHKEDLKDGVITLSFKLGYKGTFAFTAIMFILCNIFYYFFFISTDNINQFYILQLFFLPIVIYFGFWFVKVNQNPKEANFKNTMRMNLIAAICMNLCFTLFTYLNFN